VKHYQTIIKWPEKGEKKVPNGKAFPSDNLSNAILIRALFMFQHREIPS